MVRKSFQIGFGLIMWRLLYCKSTLPNFAKKHSLGEIFWICYYRVTNSATFSDFANFQCCHKYRCLLMLLIFDSHLQDKSEWFLWQPLWKTSKLWETPLQATRAKLPLFFSKSEMLISSKFSHSHRNFS